MPMTGRQVASAMGVGINLDGYFESVTPGLWGHSYSLADVERVARAGFRHIRLPVRWDTHTSQNIASVLDPAYVALIRSFVSAAVGHGLYVILDVHHFRNLEGDTPDLEETWSTNSSEAGTRLINIWNQLTTEFGGYEKVVFDIYNEPHNLMNAAVWFPLYRTIRANIRARYPDKILMLSPTDYAAYWAVWSLPTDLLDDRTIAKVHIYHPNSFTHQDVTTVSFGPGDLASLYAEIDNNAPVWRASFPQVGLSVGEYGCINRRPTPGTYVPREQRLAYCRAVSERLDLRGFDSRCWWGYRGTWGMFNQPGSPESWEPGFLSAVGLKDKKDTMPLNLPDVPRAFGAVTSVHGKLRQVLTKFEADASTGRLSPSDQREVETYFKQISELFASASASSASSSAAVAQAAASFIGARRWMFIGDSITDGSGISPAGTSFRAFAQFANRAAGGAVAAPNFVELGFPGRTSGYMLPHHLTALAANPDVGAYVVMLGMNDSDKAQGPIPIHQYIANIKTLVDRFNAERKPWVVCTIPPIGPVINSHSIAEVRARASWIRQANKVLREAVPKWGGTLADPYDALVGEDGYIQDVHQSTTPDGIHPGNSGHRAMGTAVGEAMVRAVGLRNPCLLFNVPAGNLAPDPLNVRSTASDATHYLISGGGGAAHTLGLFDDAYRQLPDGARWLQVERADHASTAATSHFFAVAAPGLVAGRTYRVTYTYQLAFLRGDRDMFVRTLDAGNNSNNNVFNLSLTALPSAANIVNDLGQGATLRHLSNGVWQGPYNTLDVVLPAGQNAIELRGLLRLQIGYDAIARVGLVSVVDLGVGAPATPTTPTLVTNA